MKNFMLSISLFITTGGLIYGQSYNLNHLNNFNSNEPLYKIAVEAEQAFDTIGRGKGTGYKQFRRWLYLSELNQSSSFSKLNLSTLERNKPLGIKQSCQWTNLGPFSDVNAANNQEANIGRIMSLTIANDHKTFFIASDGGGLWKSENAGISWIDYGDKLPTMDLSYNAIAPSDNQVLYVMDNNTIQYENNQIFKSTDGGKSFTTVNNNTVSQGRKIIINPNKDDLVLICGNRGIYYSNDGGIHFSKILQSVNQETFCDIIYHPTNPDICYACSDKSFYKSTDGGASFIKNTTVSFTKPTTMSVSALAPNDLWILCKNGWSSAMLYHSTDAGASFTTNNISKDLVGSLEYRNRALAVHPTIPDRYYAGGVSLFRWNGTQFYAVPRIHADISEMKFINDTLYVVSDGGISRIIDSPDYDEIPYSQPFTSLNNNLPIKQIYKMQVTKGAIESIIYGSQDNGTALYRNGNWCWVADGDGGDCAINSQNPDQYYYTICVLKGILSSDELYNKDLYSAGEEANTAFIFPVELDASNPSTLYYAGQQVFQKLNAESNWNAITNFEWNTDANYYTYIDLIKVAPTNSNLVYVVNNMTDKTTFNNSTIIYRSQDHCQNWEKLTLPSNVFQITDLAISPHNDKYVSFISRGDNKVYESKDYGNHWHEITTGFGSNPLYAICYDKSNVHGKYVSSLGSVYYIDSTLTSSIDFTGNLPNVQITDIEINPTLQKLYVATYGRGIFKTDLYKKDPILFEITATAGAHGQIFPNGLITIESGKDTTFTITADADYQIADLMVDHITISDTNTYTFYNVTENHNIEVNFETVESIEETLLNDLKIYTVYNTVYILNEKNREIDHVEITDVYGKTILSQSETSAPIILNVSNGIYFVKIYATNKQSKTSKILIRK